MTTQVDFIEKLYTSNTNYLYRLMTGTYKIAELQNVNYRQLVETLGPPSIAEETGDGKSFVQWVLNFNENIYTIYDYKTYDEDYTLNELTRWSIGGIGGSTLFTQQLKAEFKQNNITAKII